MYIYLEIQIRLAYKPGTSTLYGWRKQIIDQGFYQKGSDGKVPILNSDLSTDDVNPDDQVTSPVLLNGQGYILTTGTPPAPVLLYFETKKKRNFGIFNFRWQAA